MDYFERLERDLPKPRHRRIYSLLPKDQKLEVIRTAYGLTHGPGKRKKTKNKRRK